MGSYLNPGNEKFKEAIFDKLKIAEEDSYEKKMNQYDTIFVNMQEF